MDYIQVKNSCLGGNTKSSNKEEKENILLGKCHVGGQAWALLGILSFSIDPQFPYPQNGDNNAHLGLNEISM